ncbi:MAG TPA: hypothetical protein VMT47_02305 [Polyangia bacterium]|nr:hypothetical protein [Polyangia bacterium]
MSKGSRLAACAALCLAACAPRKHDLGVTTDAAIVPRVTEDAAMPIDLGPPCVPGGTSADEPATVGCTPARPGRIVVSGDHVYWTLQGSGAVLVRAPLTGGGPEPLVFDDAGTFGLVVDGTFATYVVPGLGRIMRVPVAGGTPVALATGLDQPRSLATDGASLYWTQGVGQGKIMKLDLTPGAKPIALCDGLAQPRAIAVQGGVVYWTDITDGTLLSTPDHLTVSPDAAAADAVDASVDADAADDVAADADAMADASAAADADADAADADADARSNLPPPTVLASGLKIPTDLVLVAGFAYVPDQNGYIRRVALVGGALETIADVDGAPYGVATDGTLIYWTKIGVDGGLFSAPLGGGAITPIVGGQIDPHFVAVTPEQIYWGTWGTYPAIHRLTR